MQSLKRNAGTALYPCGGMDSAVDEQRKGLTMKTFNWIAGVAVAGLLVGCAGGDRTVYEEDGIPPVVEQVAMERPVYLEPAVGESAARDIGQNLFRQYMLKSYLESRVVLSDAAEGELAEGHRFAILPGTDAWLRFESGEPTGCFDYASSPTVGQAAHVCLIDTDEDGSFDHAMFKGGEDSYEIEPVAYTRTTREHIVTDGETVQRHVVLEQITDEALIVRFPRLVGAMSQGSTGMMSFPRNSEGPTVIEHDGMKLKVDEITDTGVRYAVESGFAKL